MDGPERAGVYHHRRSNPPAEEGSRGQRMFELMGTVQLERPA